LPSKTCSDRDMGYLWLKRWWVDGIL